MRRVDSFTLLLVLPAGVLLELGTLVMVNASSMTHVLSQPAHVVRACLLLFSLGALQPTLLGMWMVLLALLLWLVGRLVWELGHR